MCDSDGTHVWGQLNQGEGIGGARLLNQTTARRPAGKKNRGRSHRRLNWRKACCWVVLLDCCTTEETGACRAESGDWSGRKKRKEEEVWEVLLLCGTAEKRRPLAAGPEQESRENEKLEPRHGSRGRTMGGVAGLDRRREETRMLLGGLLEKESKLGKLQLDRNKSAGRNRSSREDGPSQGRLAAGRNKRQRSEGARPSQSKGYKNKKNRIKMLVVKG